MTWLTARTNGFARLAMKLASEALSLQTMLDETAIPAAFIKGTTLGQLAYGNIGIKHAWDIDLLVLPRDLPRVCAKLTAAGYKRIVPPESLSADRFLAWSTFAQECLFVKQGTDIHLELHWRLSANPTLLEKITAESPMQLVAVAPGRSLRTLADEDLFSYLCLHGAYHAWSRVKWLADLAAWLSPRKAGEVEQLYRKAKENGVGRPAAQGLLLCEQLFALPLAPDFATELRKDRATRWLIAIALDTMAGDAASRPIDDRLLGNLMIGVSHFLLAVHLRGWFHELYTKSIGWTDFQNIVLPRSLYFLYPVLRIPSWLWRRAMRLRQSRQPAA